MNDLDRRPLDTFTIQTLIHKDYHCSKSSKEVLKRILSTAFMCFYDKFSCLSKNIQYFIFYIPKVKP